MVSVSFSRDIATLNYFDCEASVLEINDQTALEERIHRVSEDETCRTKIQWNLAAGCELAADLLPLFTLRVCKSGMVELGFELDQFAASTAKVWISYDHQLIPVETELKQVLPNSAQKVSFEHELDAQESTMSIHLQLADHNDRLLQFDLEYIYLLPVTKHSILMSKKALLKTAQLSDYLSIVPISSMYHPSIPSSPTSSSSESSFQETLLWDDFDSENEISDLDARFSACAHSPALVASDLCFPALDLVV